MNHYSIELEMYRNLFSTNKKSDRKLISVLSESGLVLIDSNIFQTIIERINFSYLKNLLLNNKRDVSIELTKKETTKFYSYINEYKSVDLSLEIVKFITIKTN